MPFFDSLFDNPASVYPEVANYAALPSAALNNGLIYVVLSGSGIYLVNRKSAGLYLSDGATWNRLGNIPAYFSDLNFKIYNDSDNTKQIAFDSSAITTATTRTITAPDRDLSLADPIFDSASITDTTDSTTIGTGSITTAGGLGVAKNVNIGGDLVSTGTILSSIASAKIELLNGALKRLTIDGANNKAVFNESALDFWFEIRKLSSGIAFVYNATADTITLDSDTILTSATESTSTTTGSIVTSGGLGVSKALNVGGDTRLDGALSLYPSSTGYPVFLSKSFSNTDWQGSFFEIQRSRGTESTPLDVLANDAIFSLEAKSYKNSTLRKSGLISCNADVIGTSSVEGRWSIYTWSDTDAAYREIAKITNNGIDINGAVYNKTEIKAGAYPSTLADNTIVCNSASAFDLTLHDPTTATGQELTLKNKNTGIVTLKTYNVDGATDRTLSQYDSLTIFSDGVEWLIK